MTYVIAGVLAFCGAFMRAGRWVDPGTGKFLFWKMAVELPIAVASGSVALGLATFYNWDLRIGYGIAGMLGLLGPVVLEALVEFAKAKLGIGKTP